VFQKNGFSTTFQLHVFPKNIPWKLPKSARIKTATVDNNNNTKHVKPRWLIRCGLQKKFVAEISVALI